MDGLNTNQIIKKLKDILKDIGMEGRPSLDKCRSIREKREYQKEMESISMGNIISKRRRGSSLEMNQNVIIR